MINHDARWRERGFHRYGDVTATSTQIFRAEDEVTTSFRFRKALSVHTLMMPQRSFVRISMENCVNFRSINSSFDLARAEPYSKVITPFHFN